MKDLHFINKAKCKGLIKVDLYFNDKDEFKIEKLKSIIADKKLHYERFGRIDLEVNRTLKYFKIFPLASFALLSA